MALARFPVARGSNKFCRGSSMSQAARLPFHRVPGVSHVHMLVLTGVEGLIAGDPVDRDQHPVQDQVT
jgi:hypothetical protein